VCVREKAKERNKRKREKMRTDEGVVTECVFMRKREKTSE